MDYGSVVNMGLISFLTGFGIVATYEKRNKLPVRIQARIIGGCIFSIICVALYTSVLI